MPELPPTLEAAAEIAVPKSIDASDPLAESPASFAAASLLAHSSAESCMPPGISVPHSSAESCMPPGISVPPSSAESCTPLGISVPGCTSTSRASPGALAAASVLTQSVHPSPEALAAASVLSLTRHEPSALPATAQPAPAAAAPAASAHAAAAPAASAAATPSADSACEAELATEAQAAPSVRATGDSAGPSLPQWLVPSAGRRKVDATNLPPGWDVV